MKSKSCIVGYQGWSYWNQWQFELNFGSNWLRKHLIMSNIEILEENQHNVANKRKCNLCDYASSYTSHLKQHLKVHTGEKSHKCNHCSSAFSSTSSLNSHLKTHSGERSYKCTQCDYDSCFASDVRKHTKIHNREKKQRNVTFVTTPILPKINWGNI